MAVKNNLLTNKKREKAILKSRSKPPEKLSNRQVKKLWRFVKTIRIKFNKIPKSHEELLVMAGVYAKSQNALITWMRHNLTNYDDLLAACYNRFPSGYEDKMAAVDFLRQRAGDLCCKLINELKEK